MLAKLLGIFFIIFCSVLTCPRLLSEQVSPPSPAPAATATSSQRRYPDQGYLSPARYVNGYFGFAFDLPAGAGLRPVAEPIATDGHIQLLHVAGAPPADADVSVVAFPNGGQLRHMDGKALLRRELDHDLYIGVEELHGLSKTTLGGQQFYFFETRRGIERHMLLAADLSGYVVQVVLAAHDEEILKQIESSFQHVKFFPPVQAREQAGAGAREYEGPAISLRRLALLQADPPAGHVDPGKVSGDVYGNRSLGFSYRIPHGWTLQPHGAVQPAVERARKRNADQPESGGAERELMQACRRTLFSAWAKPPDAGGHLDYDDFGEVTISAISLSCFPTLEFPASSNDAQGFQNLVAALALTHPILRDMRDAKTLDLKGSVFLLLHGNVAFKVDGDELSRRLSVAMAVTQRAGYLLTWFFAAPHDAQLQELLEDRIGLAPDPQVKQASAENPAGAQPAANSGSPAAAASAPPDAASVAGGGANPDATSPTIAPTAQSGAPQPAGSARQPNNTATTPATPRPTLLRPGETMAEQQMGGKPASKH
jgi:hypothetical protein